MKCLYITLLVISIPEGKKETDGGKEANRLDLKPVPDES
jgi:hypothetical protein